MEHYETFAETTSALLQMDKQIEDTSLSQTNDKLVQGERVDCRPLAVLCKDQGLSLACTFSLCLKSAFEEFAVQNHSLVFGLFPLDLYKLAAIAGKFEMFSPAVDNACQVLAEVYNVDAGQVSAMSTNIVQNRFYLYDACFLKDKLAELLAKRATGNTHEDAVKHKNMLREKIALEKSCEIKSYHLLEAKTAAVEVRTQFVSRFPQYRREYIEKTKAEVLAAIAKIVSSKNKVDDKFQCKQAEYLCARAGIEREMENEFNAGRLERYLCRSPMDQKMANYFHQEVIGEIKELLKYAHPDKWDPDCSDEDMKNQIAEKSRQLVQFHKLSKLGPGIMTFKLISELQSWKKEFALLNPEAAKEAFRKEQGHPLEHEVKFWEASEAYLSSELEAFFADKELQNMRVIMDAPEMQPQYEKSLEKSIAALTHRIDQCMADPDVLEQWKNVVEQARGMSGNSRMIDELYEK